MRKLLTRALCAAATVAFVAGCSVSIKAGGKDKPPPAPEPATPTPPPTPAPEPPKPKPEFKVDKEGGVALPGPVLFDVGTANLQAASDVPLQVVVDYMNAHPEITKIRIEGHTDSDDTNANNMKLSKARAMSVAHWLKGKGIACERLIAVGFGEEKPLVKPEKSEVEKAQNRRVVFIPAEKNKKPIAGRPLDGGPPGEIAGDACK